MDKEAQSTLARSVGRAIAHRRIGAGLTQEQVAERLGLALSSVARMEQGVSIPTVVRLVELAQLFDCGVDALIVEASTRTDDQAKAIAAVLNELAESDRTVLLGVLTSLAEHLRQKK
ncbi:XRE family transcriptional regulator [Burkholderia sp. Bp9017]|uniref:helix-turn-helix domain-containing protein n=1 Tax=unclassified Burkholderia TaxID=2613784 RepID=UPI000F5DC746|nr:MULTISPECIES: helix-turn-helix transcriptional regulator [unclassified Burkholderia]RQZ26111.1 XRE family transcriptional regulator [Burkholderia sp. Bp9017]RQZ33992.1 XRE family transcriptional regulator [Burkholderia sp. Bp9016]